MKVAYFDCSSGISGDMLVGAFLDVGVPFDELQKALQTLGLSEFQVEQQTVMKHGLRAVQFQVHIPHHHEHHAHRGLKEIEEIIHRSALPEEVKVRTMGSFRLLAEAEANVHGTTPDKIHFHEVGAVDAIVDIVSAHWCWWYLKMEKGFASVVHVGGGTVSCAHGVLPVPAPATALLLQGYPLQIGTPPTELTTPTGAVLLRSFTVPGEVMPPFTLEKVGMGAGTKDLEGRANVFRLMIGTCEGDVASNMEDICVVETNVDDMSGEFIPVVIQQLLEAGARDAFVVPAIGKKGRPVYLITVLCQYPILGVIQEVLLKHTTTFGIRYRTERRVVLDRKWVSVETAWGSVRVKVGYMGERIYQMSPEFEDCYQLAKKFNVPVHEVYQYAQRVAEGLQQS